MSAVLRAAPESTGVVAEAELRKLVRRIEPTPAQKDGAKRSQAFLRRQLQGGGIGERILDSYLSGSYRRKTAICPLEDVDIIFLIDPKAWPAAMFGLSDKPKPSTVLQSFAGALRYHYSGTSAFTQRRSIRLEFNHLHVDCVPAIGIEGQLRSFVVETAAVTLFTHARVNSLLDGLLMFFDFISHFASDDNEYQWGSTFGIRMSWWDFMTVPDSAETGANVAAGVGYEQMRAFQQQAATSRAHLRKALSVRSEGTLLRHLWSALNVDGP